MKSKKLKVNSKYSKFKEFEGITLIALIITKLVPTA